MAANTIAQFQKRLGVVFKDIAILKQALSHKSVGKINNERLEFLGDAVLGMEVAKLLYKHFPEIDEGALTRYRSMLVKGEMLTKLANVYQLSDMILLGEHDRKSGSQFNDSILADTFEAVIGALFLDSGNDVTAKFIEQVFSEQIERLPTTEAVKDPKTRLQEFLQAQKKSLPKYQLIKAHEQHPQLFEVVVEIIDFDIRERATAGSIRKAEKKAAARALEKIQ